MLLGTVAGVRGHVTSAGEFVVSGICFGGLRKTSQEFVNQWALRSSCFRNQLWRSNAPLPFELLAQYACGMLGFNGQMETVDEIQRVIIAGGLITEEAGTNTNAAFGNRLLTSQQDTLSSPMREVNILLSMLACYPFKECEPFVAKDTPSVFFCG